MEENISIKFWFIQDSVQLILSMPQVQYIVQLECVYCSTVSLQTNEFSNSCYSTVFEVLIAIEVSLLFKIKHRMEKTWHGPHPI